MSRLLSLRLVLLGFVLLVSGAFVLVEASWQLGRSGMAWPVALLVPGAVLAFAATSSVLGARAAGRSGPSSENSIEAVMLLGGGLSVGLMTSVGMRYAFAQAGSLSVEWWLTTVVMAGIFAVAWATVPAWLYEEWGRRHGR